MAIFSFQTTGLFFKEPSTGVKRCWVTIYRTGDISQAASVVLHAYGSGSNPATIGDDLAVIGFWGQTVLNFEPGRNNMLVAIDVKADAMMEADETFVIELKDPINPSLDAPKATITIIDSSSTALPTVSAVANNPKVLEGDVGLRPIKFTLVRSGNLDGDTTVQFKLVRGDGQTAPLSDDLYNYYNYTHTVQFLTGSSSIDWYETIWSDDVVELNEDVKLQILDIKGGVIGTPSAVISIVNDDSATEFPNLSIRSDTSIQTEGNDGVKAYTFTVTRSGDLSVSSEVSWKVEGSGLTPAKVGEDLSADNVTGKLIFNVGESSKSITVNVRGDLLVEKNETYMVSIFDPINSKIELQSAFAVIRDDELVQDTTYSIKAKNNSIQEGNSGTTSYSFIITRSGDISKSGSVIYKVVESGVHPAKIGYDIGHMAAQPMYMGFGAGTNEAEIKIEVMSDQEVEFDETFSVVLYDPEAGGLGISSAEGRILNDDKALSFLSIVPLSAAKFEGSLGADSSTPFTFVVTRSGDLSSTASVKWTLDGLDGVQTSAIDKGDIGGLIPATSGTVSFYPGQSGATITIPILCDALKEVNESISIRIFEATGAEISNSIASGTVINDDGIPYLNVSAAQADTIEGESGIRPFFVKIQRTGDLTTASSVDWVLKGSGAIPADLDQDLDLSKVSKSGTLKFAAGESEILMEFPIVGDTNFESNETFSFEIKNPQNALLKSSLVTGTIINDDPKPSELKLVAVNAVKYEGNNAGAVSEMAFKVQRTGDLSRAASVKWKVLGSDKPTSDKATSDDFIFNEVSGLTGSVDFASDQTSATIIIKVNPDQKIELDEFFTVQLFDPKNATIESATAQGLIANDDYIGELSISGPLRVGETLKALSTIDFAVKREIVAFQWRADGVDILGAKSDSLLVDQAYLGKKLSVTASFNGIAGVLSLNSTQTKEIGPFNHPVSGAVSILGDALVGKTLSVTHSLVDVDGFGTFNYSWSADGIIISNSNTQSLLLTENLAGKSVIATVSYIDSLGNQESLSSNSSDPISLVLYGGTGADKLLGTTTNDIIYGESGNDTLFGSSGDDSLFGGADDDILTGGPGNDVLNGGSGIDVVVFSGKLSDYSIRFGAGEIVDKRSIDGSDQFSQVEVLQFSDLSVNLQTKNAYQALDQGKARSIVELYIAFFRRIPDAAGLKYWLDVAMNGTSLEQIANSFYSAGQQFTESTGYRVGMSDAEFINKIYSNVLGRPDGADAEGLNYWQSSLQSGKASRGGLAISILNSAHSFKGNAIYGVVADLLDNRFEVAHKVAVEWGIDYGTPELAISKTMEILAAVTATNTSTALELIGVNSTNFVFV